MGKRLNYIKLLNEIVSQFTDVVGNLWKIVKATKDTQTVNELSEFVAKYSALNYKFSCYLIGKTFPAYSADKDEREFNDLMNKNFYGKEKDED